MDGDSEGPPFAEVHSESEVRQNGFAQLLPDDSATEAAIRRCDPSGHTLTASEKPAVTLDSLVDFCGT